MRSNRAIERFQQGQPYQADGLRLADAQPTAGHSLGAEAPPRAALGKRLEVRDVLGRAPLDLASRCRRVACPIHGAPARFEMNGGAAQVWFCCDVLLSLVRELSNDDGVG